MTGVTGQDSKRHATLTQDANHISTSAFARATILRLCNSVDLLLVHGLVGVVEKIYDLSELSDAGVWSNPSQEPTQRWGA
jgi:hypothetical protein